MIATSRKQNKGFALLLTLVVISIILSVGLSLLDITLKQLVLSGTNRDSEVAFHAAQAGVECAEYWIRNDDTNASGHFISEQNAGPNNAYVLPSCMTSNLAGVYTDLGSYVHQSSYSLTWGPDADQCTEIDLFVLDAISAGSDVTYNFIPAYGYRDITCESGRICRVVFSRGYNRACNDINNLRSIQREIVREL